MVQLTLDREVGIDLSVPQAEPDQPSVKVAAPVPDVLPAGVEKRVSSRS
ncbi:MAG: hypothetical protein ACYDA0_09655 [Candidatus Dormibacteraceae bacterium]